ncbi:hypothetical protein ACFFQW_35780 [Umezawaea endophytica]|uniref:Uncharacterized protein n=1 Tax=Umezawaea endophytica TaxID=1654476 RepID=A0A9X2VUK4_9PSEU|nr:hypothetical protein [Umezawaea endophytica]MCS7483216.1 hypothetical protein [Umezawaea endophytica]
MTHPADLSPDREIPPFWGNLGPQRGGRCPPGRPLAHGIGGIGETELLPRYGHRATFLGGKLYLDLQRYDPERRGAPVDALSSLLWMHGLENPPTEAERAALFRLLSLHPGDIDVASTAALADLPPTRARRLLADLRAAHLLEQGNRFHDLVRLYALHCLTDADLPDEDGESALRRLVAYYPAAAAEHSRTIKNHVCDPKSLAWMDRNHETVLVMALHRHG